MAKQTLMWTTLPNGGKGNAGETLRLSVLLSPRLELTSAGEKRRLAQFPEMAKWPAKAQALKFIVNFKDATATVSETATVVSELDGDLWGKMFPPDTLVRSHLFDKMDDRFIVSYPYSHMAKSIKGVYQFVAAASPAGYPAANGLRNLLSPLNRARTGQGVTRSQLDSLKKQFEKTRAVPPTSSPNLAADIQLFQLFHTPQVNTVLDPQTGKPITKLSPLPQADDFADQIDFHQMVSSLGKHPELLKRLGLLFDLEVKLPSNIATDGLVWVDVSPAGKSPDTDVKPRTHYITANGFQSKAKNKSLQNGLLPLNGSEFDLVQIDVDGATMKMLGLNNTLESAQNLKTTDTPQFLSVPSLRSGGLNLARAGRALELAQNIGNSTKNDTQLKKLTTGLAASGANKKTVENANVIELWAEDLTRGYRIDAREVPVDANGDAATTAPGEWRSLMRRVGDYALSSTPLPAFKPDEGTIQIAVTQSASASEASKPELYLHEAVFRWAGWSLAAPRPGKTLGPDDTPQESGNGAPPGMDLEISFKPEPATLPRLRFGKRYQMRARVCDLAGNGPSHALKGNAGATDADEGFYARFEPVTSPTMVLTKELNDAQTPGESLERIVIRSRNTSPDKDDELSPENSVRHIAPPKTSQEMAELHGMFDSGGLNPADYATFADKDGDFEGPQRTGRLAPDAQLDLPYLPDPFAVSALFLGLPGSKPANFYLDKQAFDGVWPDKKPFRLRVKEDSAGWNAGDRVLDVALPKAEVYTVAMYSQMPAARIVDMGVWRWTEEALASQPDKLALYKKIAQLGVFWMLTPPRFLTFVHATQQPIGIAKWNKLEPSRNIGDTFAVFEGALLCHGKSTGKVDVLAAWNEPVDNPLDPNNNPAEDRLEGRKVAWEMPLHIGKTRIIADTVLKLADSKGAYGTYTENGTVLKFGETENMQSATALAAFVISNPRRHDFGDTKHRLVRYTAKSTTRFREYFPLEIRKDEDNLTRVSPERALHVPSSARPDAPKVLYVVPTFRWERGATSSTRKAGLRVYLDRPWYSSGDNELLGVVVLNASKNFGGDNSADIDFLISKTRGSFQRAEVGRVVVEQSAPSTPKSMSDITSAILKSNTSATISPSAAGATNFNAAKINTEATNVKSATSSTRSSVASSAINNTRILATIPEVTISPSAVEDMKAEQIRATEKFASQVAISSIKTPIGLIFSELIATAPPSPPPPIPDNLKPYVTQWGMDPIWSSAPTRGVPSPKSFPLATAIGTDLSLDELPFTPVAAAGHTPQYDDARGLWYCDIEMNAGLSYFPFVRLALARFQPYSIDGAHLSRVVLADFAQLAPNRSASFVRNGNGVRVTVSGPWGRGDSVGTADGGRFKAVPVANIGRVEVVVERRNSDSDLSWRAVANSSVNLEPNAIAGDNPLKTWTGEVSLPSSDGDDFRLIIKEWESYRADKPDTTSQNPNWSDEWRRAERLVYADVIPL